MNQPNSSSLLFYQIRPACGTNLTLSLDLNNPTGNLIVATLKTPATDEQLWQIITLVTPTRSYTGALYNKLSGLVAYAPQDDAKVLQVSLEQLVTGVVDPGRATWNYWGSSGAPGALQLSGNTGMNLNVSGNGPYPPGTQVLAFNWSGGAPNEIWTCSPVIQAEQSLAKTA